MAENLETICGNLTEADTIGSQYKDEEDNQKQAAQLAKLSKNITGQDIDYSNVPRELRAAAAKQFNILAQQRTLNYIKPNLEQAVNQAGAEQLAFATAMSIQEHKSKTYSDLANLLIQYQLINHLQMSKDKEEKQAIVGELLPEFVRERIKGTVPDEDLDIIASIIAAVAPHDQKYFQKVMGEGTKRVQDNLKAYNRGSIAGYLKEQLGDDDRKYLSFASALGTAYKKAA